MGQTSHHSLGEENIPSGFVVSERSIAHVLQPALERLAVGVTAPRAWLFLFLVAVVRVGRDRIVLAQSRLTPALLLSRALSFYIITFRTR